MSNATAKVIAVVGLSAVGKSTLCRKVSAMCSDIAAVDASFFLSEHQKKYPLYDTEDNQRIIAQGLKLRASSLEANHILLVAAHSVIETCDTITAVSPSSFLEMGIRGIVHLSEDPQVISLERKKRSKPLHFQDVRRICELQLLSEEAAVTIARSLHVPVLKIYGRHQISKLVSFLRNDDII